MKLSSKITFILFLSIICIPHSRAAELPVSYQIISKRPNSTETYSLSKIIRSKAEVIKQLGLSLDPKDRVFFSPDPSLGLGTTVTIERAPQIIIMDGKHQTKITTWQTTPGSILKENSIDLAEADKITPSLESEVKNSDKITITRVAETDIVEKIVIPFETKDIKDNTLEKGKKVTEKVGKNGERQKTYHVRREDGEEVSRKLTLDKVTIKPEQAIIKHGTKLPNLGSGTATWYEGRGVGPLTAASKSIPKGTDVLVTATSSGKSVIVTVNDYGPFGAEIDLSRDAFTALAPIGAGRISVKVEKWIPD